MAWTFDLPSVRVMTDTANITNQIEPVYDGKNLWYVSEDKKRVFVLDFWGPYNNELNGFYSRHLALEDDEIRVGSRGPDLRYLKCYSFVDSISSITYYDNAVYVATSSSDEENPLIGTLIFRLSTDLGATSSTKIDTPTGQVDEISEIDVFCKTVHLNSEIVCLNGKLFFASVAPFTQDGSDAQNLCWIDIDDATGEYILSGQTQIPGRKQLKTRSITTANDCVYVSSYNELSIYKFNSSGAFLNAIQVNRDINWLYSIGNEVWVVSSYKSPLVFGEGEFGIDIERDAAMISRISSSDVLTHVVGMPGDSFDTAPNAYSRPSLGLQGNYLWVSGYNGAYSRINLSGLTSISSDRRSVGLDTCITEEESRRLEAFDLEYEPPGQDFMIERNHIVYTGEMPYTQQITLPCVNTGQSAPPCPGDKPIDAGAGEFVANEVGVKCLFVTPPTFYQWYDGSTFQTVNIPSYLFLFNDAVILMQRLPGAFTWKSNLKINQYVALSTGARRYKAD